MKCPLRLVVSVEAPVTLVCTISSTLRLVQLSKRALPLALEKAPLTRHSKKKKKILTESIKF